MDFSKITPKMREKMKQMAFELKSEMNGSKDILHSNGSKAYYIRYADEYVVIERPVVVEFLEKILSEEHLGWSYMKQVQNAFDTGFITKDELSKIVKILD